MEETERRKLSEGDWIVIDQYGEPPDGCIFMRGELVCVTNSLGDLEMRLKKVTFSNNTSPEDALKAIEEARGRLRHLEDHFKKMHRFYEGQKKTKPEK